jgi:hypothetical protein
LLFKLRLNNNIHRLINTGFLIGQSSTMLKLKN